MSRPAPVLPRTRADDVPPTVYRSAARSVVRVLVLAQAALLALAVVEVEATGEALPLQLALVVILFSTVPGALMATEAVARARVDRTLRLMAQQLREAPSDETRSTDPA